MSSIVSITRNILSKNLNPLGLIRTNILPSTALMKLSTKNDATTPILADDSKIVVSSAKNVKPDKDSVILQEEKKKKAVIHSILSMSAATSFHFFGYEFLRSSGLALFTSSNLFPRTTTSDKYEMYSIAMLCVAPTSFAFIWIYGRQLDKHGPKYALRNTTLFSAFTIGLFSTLIYSFSSPSLLYKFSGQFSHKLIVFLSFIFQNSYAHLLWNQQGSFNNSVLTSKELGSKYFPIIAGITSVSSTIGATLASKLCNRMNLSVFMSVTSIALLISTYFANLAYSIAEKNGFDPAKEMSRAKMEKANKTIGATKSSKTSSKLGKLHEAYHLFKRVPILGFLFCEVLSFQSLSMILNVSFVRMLKSTFQEHDSLRAAYTAKFYAVTNGISGILQFFILPFIMSRLNPKLLWKFMPIFALLCTSSEYFYNHYYNSESSASSSPLSMLRFVSAVFFIIKMMDYSFRGVATEMVYVPLDFESRYLGKEIIGVFANRLGKSVISFILSILPTIFISTTNGKNLDMKHLSMLSILSCILWIIFGLKVSQNQEDTEETVDKKLK